MQEYWVWDPHGVSPDYFDPDVVQAFDSEEAATSWVEDNWGDLDYPETMDVAVALASFDGEPTFAQVGHLEVFRVNAEETVTFTATTPD